MPRYLLGLDVGTTASKAVLLDLDGGALRSESAPHPLLTPRPGWAEQDPHDWWASAARSIQAVLRAAHADAGDVAGVGLTGQMHGLVLLDARGEVLRPAILWNDQRTGAECAAITRAVGAARVLRITGSPVLPGFTAPKIAWVRAHEPHVASRVARLLLPKDYVRYRLTGRYATDVSDASGTALFDVGARRWSDEMLAALDVPRGWLPEATESPVVSAVVSDEGARETGLHAGTPVVGGAGDQAAQAVGAGVVEPGRALVTLGTSGVVFAAVDAYRPEPEGRLHAFCHAVPGRWHLMGVMLSAAGSLQWYRDALTDAGDEPPSFDALVAAAAGVPAGAEGLLFLPYLSGERTPHPDPHARGAFVGLSLRHRKAHLTRAVLEGVAFGLRDSLELMRAVGVDARQLRASGGGARSPLWRRILADVLGVELATADANGAAGGAAYGAALLAGVGMGVFPSVAVAAEANLGEAERVRPGPDAARYAEYYARYRALYPALAAELHALTRLAEAGGERAPS